MKHVVFMVGVLPVGSQNTLFLLYFNAVQLDFFSTVSFPTLDFAPFWDVQYPRDRRNGVWFSPVFCPSEVHCTRGAHKPVNTPTC